MHLGRGTRNEAAFPIQTPNVDAARDLAAGEKHFCVIVDQEDGGGSGGALKCAGDDTYGVLGRIATTDEAKYTLQHATSLALGVKAVFSGPYQVFAVMEGAGVLYAFATHTLVTGFESGGAVMATGSDSHACVVATNGSLHCVGYNKYGQLGMGNQVNLQRLTPVPGLSSVVQTACGFLHTCALTSLGTVQCFGQNKDGQLGTGEPLTASLSPAPVIGLSMAVTELIAYSFATCIVYDGARNASCFGKDMYGKFGSGSTDTYYATPAQYGQGISGIAELRLGYYNSGVFLQRAGMVMVINVAGRGNNAQLGNGQTLESNVLVQTQDLPIARTLSPSVISSSSSSLATITTACFNATVLACFVILLLAR